MFDLKILICRSSFKINLACVLMFLGNVISLGPVQWYTPQGTIFKRSKSGKGNEQASIDIRA